MVNHQPPPLLPPYSLHYLSYDEPPFIIYHLHVCLQKFAYKYLEELSLEVRKSDHKRITKFLLPSPPLLGTIEPPPLCAPPFAHHPLTDETTSVAHRRPTPYPQPFATLSPLFFAHSFVSFVARCRSPNIDADLCPVACTARGSHRGFCSALFVPAPRSDANLFL
ncbi:hypothetical protein BVRB_6g136100 [Beta vulgaris subsp. vulgaris]|nr:hypothetical protein BVRB_6g136100 [Beta vulgaris subsp. vulgaris]